MQLSLPNSLAELNHAYILEGDREYSLAYLSQYAKKHLSIHNLADHVDVLLSEGSAMKIEDSRQLRHLLFQKPVGLKKLCILTGAEKLSVLIQNSLLKIVEEPPDNVLFFFLTDNAAGILQTIRSRCQHIYFVETSEERDGAQSIEATPDLFPFFQSKEWEKMDREAITARLDDLTHRLWEGYKSDHTGSAKEKAEWEQRLTDDTTVAVVSHLEKAKRRIAANCHIAHTLECCLFSIAEEISWWK